MDELRGILRQEMNVYQDFVTYLAQVFNAYYRKCFQDRCDIHNVTAETIEWILNYNNKQPNQKMRLSKRHSLLLVDLVKHAPQRLFPFKCTHVGVNILRWVENYWESEAYKAKVTAALVAHLEKNHIHVAPSMVDAIWQFQPYLCTSSADQIMYSKASALLCNIRHMDNYIVMMENPQETIFPRAHELLQYMELNVTTSRCVNGNSNWLELDYPTVRHRQLMDVIINLYYAASDEFYFQADYVSDHTPSHVFSEFVAGDNPPPSSSCRLTSQFIETVQHLLRP